MLAALHGMAWQWDFCVACNTVTWSCSGAHSDGASAWLAHVCSSTGQVRGRPHHRSVQPLSTTRLKCRTSAPCLSQVRTCSPALCAGTLASTFSKTYSEPGSTVVTAMQQHICTNVDPPSMQLPTDPCTNLAANRDSTSATVTTCTYGRSYRACPPSTLALTNEAWCTVFGSRVSLLH